MRLVLALTLVLLATAAVAGEPTTPASETKPIDEVSALKIEKGELAFQAVQSEIKALQERSERIKEQVLAFIAGLRQKADVDEKWQMDLANRRFVKPPEPKSEAKPDAKE